MGLTRVATSKDKEKYALVLVVDNKELKLTHKDLEKENTADKIVKVIEKQAGDTSLPSIFVHLNRDGSLALATGAEPGVWPEDELDVREIHG